MTAGIASNAIASVAIAGSGEASVSLSPAFANLVLSSTAPLVVVDVRQDPAQANLALSATAPTLLVDVRFDPAQANLVLSATAPSALHAVTITPATRDLVLSGTAPSALHAINLSPATANLVLSATAPTVAVNTYMRPDADVDDGTWTNSDDGGELFSYIDEDVINDVDFIKSANSPVNDLCKISLSDPVVEPGNPFDVMYRYKKQGGATIELRVRLLEGTTQIASWTHSDIADSFLTATQTLTGEERLSITNMNNLFIEFRANAS